MLLSNHRGVDINMNDIMKEKHGFTLVELLAVIVVLAIIMLIAVQAVLPLLQDARKKAFATEVQAAIEAAQTYYVAKSLSKNATVGDGLYVDLQTLIDENMYSTKRTGYSGYVKIYPKSTTGSNDYLYQIWMTNGQYAVDGKGVKDEQNQAIDPDVDITEGTTYTAKPTKVRWLEKDGVVTK